MQFVLSCIQKYHMRDEDGWMFRRNYHATEPEPRHRHASGNIKGFIGCPYDPSTAIFVVYVITVSEQLVIPFNGMVPDSFAL